MSPDQALGMRDMFAQQIENESKTTRRVIAAVPLDKGDYKPEPVAKSALELAWHIASAEIWFINAVGDGQFAKVDDHGVPANIKNSADILAWYDAEFEKAIAKVKALDGEACTKVISFYDIFFLPAVQYLMFNLVHVIHHRGQLSVYLRPMGSKCPSIYGGSADEPFQMPAKANA